VKRIALALLLAGCAARSGEVRDGAVVPQQVLEVRWRHRLIDPQVYIEWKPQEFSAAASDGTRVFVGASEGWFYGFSARDGATLWRKKLDGGVTGRPRIDGDVVYVGSQGGVLYAFDASTGREHWTYKVKAPIETQPVVAHGAVFFTTGENRVYAVDAHKGTWKWQYDREVPEQSFTIRGQSAPMVHAGRVYVGFADGYLACLAAGTGDVAWARGLGGDASRFVDVDATPVVSGDTLYVSSFSGGVYALDPRDGSTRWRYEVDGAGSVRVAHGRVYFSSAKMGLHALDLDGRLLWRQSVGVGGEMSAPLIINGYVIVSAAGGGGYLTGGGTYVADARTGRLLQFFFPGHGATAEATTDGRLVFLVSNNGYFYAFGLDGSGKVSRGVTDVPPV
jgi:outer membrane protein assembly factor BamB